MCPLEEVLLVNKRDEANGWHVITAAGFGGRRIEGEEQGQAVVSKFKDATEKQIVPREAYLPEGPQGATP